MTLQKAIEIKLREGDAFIHTSSAEANEADRLSIEAMKAIQRHRHDNMPAAFIVLPGETPAGPRGLTETVFYNPEKD